MEFKIGNLSEKEVNTILQALSNQPYIQVVDLINKVHSQCQNQINQQPPQPEILD